MDYAVKEYNDIVSYHSAIALLIGCGKVLFAPHVSFAETDGLNGRSSYRRT
jgi:hypothetical protein